MKAHVYEVGRDWLVPGIGIVRGMSKDERRVPLLENPENRVSRRALLEPGRMAELEGKTKAAQAECRLGALGRGEKGEKTLGVHAKAGR